MNLTPALTFESVSIVLPVMDETDALLETVEIILRDNDKDVREFLIVVCEKTTPQSRAVCESLKQRLGPRVNLIQQQRPYLGGAVRDAFEQARGSSHVLMMASDLETPPARVRELIAEARKHPQALITASRWVKGGSFEGYNPIKRFLNFLFQRLFSILYRVRLSDMTYGYRLFPRALAQSIEWEELRHPFLFETLIKPLRLGVPAVEIPCEWKARAEGKSQNTFLRNFLYFRIGFKTLFRSRENILKEGASWGSEEQQTR